MLNITTVYSNSRSLNLSQHLIRKRSSLLLDFCFTESYQIHFLPEKLNLMIGTTGHISSITLISFSTADLYQTDLLPASPWRDTWSLTSEISDLPSDTMSHSNWKTPTSKIYFFLFHYISAVEVTQHKSTTHTTCRGLAKYQLRIRTNVSYPKRQLFLNTMILANNLPACSKHYLQRHISQTNIFIWNT